MSYAKAIKHRTPKKQKMHMGFSALYIAQWHKTTEEMLKANPDLVIIG